MSLIDTIHHHEINEAEYAKSAIRVMHRGDDHWRELAAASATHRHLAYEHRETHRITMDAFAEHYGVNR